MENVPSNIDFAGKKSKAKDEFEKKNEQSLDALACSISHPSMNKILGIQSIDHRSIHVVVE
jgi:hypothetical protein